MKNRRPDDYSPRHIIAVSRAISVLDAFKSREAWLSLGELARRTCMHKTTTLRVCRTLSLSRYLVQSAEGSWRLGPAAGRLGLHYQASFDREAIIEPVLRELSLKTRESAAFYVREANSRVCVARVEGPEAIHHHVRVGEILPIELGAIGRVLLAFSAEPGTFYEKIRQQGFHMTPGERDPQVASMGCPVFGVNRNLIGAIGVSGPISRYSKKIYTGHLLHLRKAAGRLSLLVAKQALKLH